MIDKTTILVIDDVPSTRETIKDVLEEKGYRVFVAGGGKEALKILEANPCDVVLLDLVMPAMNGIETLQAIKAKNVDIEVVIVTGHAEVETAISAVNGGAFAYVQKPLKFSLLDHYLEEIVKKRETRTGVIESEEKYRYLAENAGDIIFVIDTEGNFTFVNERAKEITGYTVDEILSMNMGDLLTTKSHQLALELLDKRMKGERISPYEVSILKKDESEALFELNTSAIMQGGKIAGVQGVAREVTLRNTLERELKQQTRNAQLYLDLMAHDITNVNHVILGYLELLQTKKDLDEETKMRYIDAMQSELGRAISLIENVKILSRLDEVKCEFRPVDLVQVIDEAVKTIEINEWVDETQVSIQFDCEKGVNYAIMADDLVLSIFTNLVDNAIKYSLSKGAGIDIKLERDEKFVRASVTDYGRGIMDTEKKIIFQRYMRVDGGIKGSGIGLSLVCELVRRYNGKIWVEDRVDGDYSQGARFIVEFPVA